MLIHCTYKSYSAEIPKFYTEPPLCVNETFVTRQGIFSINNYSNDDNKIATLATA